MIHGSMSMGTAGIVCIVSMLIVFAVLLILYVATMIMGSVLGKMKKPAAAPKAAPPRLLPLPPLPSRMTASCWPFWPPLLLPSKAAATPWSATARTWTDPSKLKSIKTLSLEEKIQHEILYHHR